ncbi:ZCHC3 protein, partial [Atractosteus spatula]|nr:ZCHC3 protein [Atractosteus spatula]
MFNPYVPEGDIVCYLKRFVDIQGVGEKLMDRKGYWTGKRRYRVRLRPDGQAPDGLLHPPASFFIGANNGYCYYYGQPAVCRRCGKPEHNAADCRELICRRCEGVGHSAVNCTAKPKCNLCGGEGHIFKDCEQRKKSFAEIVQGSRSAPAARTEGHRSEEEMDSADMEEAGEVSTAGTEDTTRGRELTGGESKEVSSGLEVMKEVVGGMSWGDMAEEMESGQVHTKHKCKRKNLEPDEELIRKAGRSADNMEVEVEKDYLASTGMGAQGGIAISIPTFQDVLSESSCSPGPNLIIEETPLQSQEEVRSLPGGMPEERAEVWFDAGLSSKFLRLCRWDEKTASVKWPEHFEGSVFEKRGIRVRPVVNDGDISAIQLYAGDSRDVAQQRYRVADLVRTWVEDVEKDEVNFEQKKFRRKETLKAKLVVPREFLHACKLVDGSVIYPPDTGGICSMLQGFKSVRVEAERSRERVVGLLVCGTFEREMREVYVRFSCLVREWSQKGCC